MSSSTQFRGYSQYVALSEIGKELPEPRRMANRINVARILRKEFNE
jgi:hypothetical protein